MMWLLVQFRECVNSFCFLDRDMGAIIYWFNFLIVLSVALVLFEKARFRERFQVMKEAAEIDGCG